MTANLTVRRLLPAERYDARVIFAVSMHGRIGDPEETRRECEKQTTDAWGTFAPDGRLVSQALLFHYRNFFDGQPVPCSAITAAATLPEYRRRGAASALIREMLQTSRREGEVFSMLYPYRHDFYRRFGFETVPMQNDYRFSPEVLADYRFGGTAELWRPGDPAGEFTDLCNRFAAGCNMAAYRSEEAMREHMDGAFPESRVFCYLLKEDGEAVAYVIFQDDRVPPGVSTLAVGDAAWDGARGFRAILGFLSRFAPDYQKIEFYLPGGMELYSLIRSRRSFEIEKTTRQDFMVQALDVVRVLELLRKPAGTSFVIRVTDGLIEENNGTWRVTDRSVLPAEDAPDLAVSVGAFSQMAVGGVGLEEALLRDDVELFCSPDALRGVFCRKPVLVRENF